MKIQKMRKKDKTNSMGVPAHGLCASAFLCIV